MTFYEQLTLAMNQLPFWAVCVLLVFSLFLIVILANWIILPFKIGRIGNELAKLRKFLSEDLRMMQEEKLSEEALNTSCYANHVKSSQTVQSEILPPPSPKCNGGTLQT